ncbi:MAG TPA: hypothetical protein VGK26_06580 [Thermoanaerobaculia bacterium]
MPRFPQPPRDKTLGLAAPSFLLGLVLCAGLVAPAALSGLTGGDGSRRDAYVLVLGKNMYSTNLNFDSFDRMRDRHSGDFLWFRRNGAGYLVEDPATLREAQELFAPLRALEPEQKDLSRRQEELSEKEEALDRQQDALDSEIDRLTEETGESRGDWDDEFSVSEEAETAPPTDEEQAEIDREVENLRNRKDALRPRQDEVEAKSRELDAEERALDAREDRLERAAETRLWKLLDDAVRSGAAKPAETP